LFLSQGRRQCCDVLFREAWLPFLDEVPVQLRVREIWQLLLGASEKEEIMVEFGLEFLPKQWMVM